MGNCLCVLGDAMAMPVSSLVNKFRDEFEAHLERVRASEDFMLGVDPAQAATSRPRSARSRKPLPHRSSMPRPQRTPITFTIDGRDVVAPEGTMLADAAKHGDVEIPVFCYEPKLGAPVGACRMCLVEVEGIRSSRPPARRPSRTAWSSTRPPEGEGRPRSVLEFLLVNHPLDCPVCDKGGECPLQDISYGWGRGLSRVAEPSATSRSRSS